MGAKLNSTQKREVLQRLAAGQFQTEVASEFGVSKSTISKLASKQESREFIEKESKRLLESLPDIIDAIKRDLATAKKLADYFAGNEDHGADEILKRLVHNGKYGPDLTAAMKLYQVVSKKQSDYMRAVGILPSQSPSIFIQKIYQDNRKQVFSPRVMEMIGKFGATLRLPKNDPTQGSQPQDGENPQNGEPLGQ